MQNKRLLYEAMEDVKERERKRERGRDRKHGEPASIEGTTWLGSELQLLKRVCWCWWQKKGGEAYKIQSISRV